MSEFDQAAAEAALASHELFTKCHPLASHNPLADHLRAALADRDRLAAENARLRGRVAELSWPFPKLSEVPHA